MLESGRPVLVDFHAPECLPCTQLAPVIEQLAHDFEHRARIVTIDIEAAPWIAARCRVEQVPCLVFFSSGKEVGRLVGAPTRGTLTTLLETIGA
mgnify:FL=1